jgi:glc operon protein GlcG
MSSAFGDKKAPTFQNRKFHHIFDLTVATMKRCEELACEAVVTAVDASGHTVVLLRTDAAPWLAMEPSRRKAATAAGMHVQTAAIAQMAAMDPIMKSILDSMDALAAPGGFPIMLDGECIGGLGIAAGMYSEDQAIGEYVIYGGVMPYMPPGPPPGPGGPGAPGGPPR